MAGPRVRRIFVNGSPGSRWRGGIPRYHNEGESVRHVGPMAQDFHAAFGLGGDDKSITPVDADGVALAAIQGLNQKVEAETQRSEVRTRKLEEKLQRKETEPTELKQRLEKLEQHFEYKLNGGARCEPED